MCTVFIGILHFRFGVHAPYKPYFLDKSLRLQYEIGKEHAVQVTAAIGGQYQQRIIDSQGKQEYSRPVREVKKDSGQYAIESKRRECTPSHRAGSALTSARSVC